MCLYLPDALLQKLEVEIHRRRNQIRAQTMHKVELRATHKQATPELEKSDLEAPHQVGNAGFSSAICGVLRSWQPISAGPIHHENVASPFLACHAAQRRSCAQ